MCFSRQKSILGVQGLVVLRVPGFDFRRVLSNCWCQFWANFGVTEIAPLWTHFWSQKWQFWVHFWAPEIGPFLGPRNGSLKSVPTKNKKGPKLGPKNWSKFGPKNRTPKIKKMTKRGPKIRHTNGPKTWTQKLAPKGDPQK